MAYESVNKQYESTFRSCWDRPAVSNYGGVTLTYGEMATQMARLQSLFRAAGLSKGDKVAVCGRNQTGWTVAFFAALTFGAVPVPLLHEFNPENIRGLLRHSGSGIIFADESILSKVDLEGLGGLKAAVSLADFHIVSGDRSLYTAAEEDFTAMYPQGFGPDDISYHEDSPDDLAIINYTSGTSGFSKGVMIPYRALRVNLDAAIKLAEPQMDSTSTSLAVLPEAHMYGLMFETMFEMAIGAHTYYLTKMPTPQVLVQAFREVHPGVIIFVPLIMEKVYRASLKPAARKYSALLKLPVAGDVIRRKMRDTLTESFGSTFKETIMGGAAFNPEVENFLHDMGFRYTCGYGMTECAPLITYVTWQDVKPGGCGKAIPGCSIRVDSPDPEHVPGEVQVKGDNVFLGYYDNPEATQAAFTDDGWFRTGDMGVIDSEGYLFLRGRSKCMILSANGQNIYPEELEAVINQHDYVGDSLVVDDNGKLTAIIHPDYARALHDGLSREQAEKAVTEALPKYNSALPAYARIRKVEILRDDFERTPKKSIKRYIYQK